MRSEARKLRVIGEVLKLEDEVLLAKVELLLEDRDVEKNSQNTKPSDYAGCISKDTARQLLQQLEQSRNEWERDI